MMLVADLQEEWLTIAPGVDDHDGWFTMPLTPRLKRIKSRLFEVEFHDSGTWHFKDVNILDGNERLAQEPMVVRKALAHAYICEHLPAIIKPDELIIGNPNQNSVGWGTVMPKYYTKDEGEQAARYRLNEASVWGHHPPDWGKIVRGGVISVKQEINEAIQKQFWAATPDQEALNEYRAMLIALDGLVEFAKRHAQVALKEALACADPVRRRELFEIYEACSHVPLHPARSLLEAAQSFWLTYCIVNSGGEYVPLGRADQVLYPYLKRDLDDCNITTERAFDIIGSFLAKCNERVIIDTKQAENHYNFGLFSQGVTPDEFEAVNSTGGYDQRALTWRADEDINSDANYNYGQSGNDWLMNCIVGGVDANGKDATNAVSYLFVDIMHQMNLLMPTLGARVHRNMPESFLRLVASVLRYGQGEPMIYNDEAIIPGFVDLGVPVADARDYSNDGCWETLVQGKSYFSYAHIMNLRCLEWTLLRGVSLNNNEQEGLDTGDPTQFKDFEAFYQAYTRQINDRIDFQCRRRLANFGLSYMIAPDPLMSAITHNCVEKGRDLSQNGAKYVFHLILATGVSNTVDALAVIKKLVYEDKTVKMADLIQALKDNWVGHETLRARVQNSVPKFGNDDDYVDSIAVRVLNDFDGYVGEWRRKQNVMLFPVGVGTFENYAVLGRDIGASADGRGFGDPLATNYTPYPGVDVQGPTAIIKSVTKPNLLRYYCGCPVDFSINANEVEGEAGIDRLMGLITSFCDLGGQIMTITSTSVEDLKDAKIHPERHKGLRVRMGGLSAYFIAMAPVQQDNVIKRFTR
jgi:pyruvate-formate lyase